MEIPTGRLVERRGEAAPASPRIIVRIPDMLHHPSLILATLAAALVLPRAARAPWEALDSGTSASLRGLNVADERTVWASGQRGTVVTSADGGATWRDVSIPGATAFDVRAIHARSALVAHAAATAGRIWRTTDGGRTWSERYVASDTTVFLDAIVFFDDRRGVALGDPMRGRFLLLVTDDGGERWREASERSRPPAMPGEAAFAASGTSLAVIGASRIWLGTGGTVARVFRSTDGGRSWDVTPVPVASGLASTGVFSVAMASDAVGIVVGGDYQRPDSASGTAAHTSDGGRSWVPARRGPSGYRSGAAIARVGDRVVAVAVGTTGTDVSVDAGLTWSPLDASNFNAVQISPAGIAFAAGGRGRIARMDLRTVSASRE